MIEYRFEGGQLSRSITKTSNVSVQTVVDQFVNEHHGDDVKFSIVTVADIIEKIETTRYHVTVETGEKQFETYQVTPCEHT